MALPVTRNYRYTQYNATFFSRVVPTSSPSDTCNGGNPSRESHPVRCPTATAARQLAVRSSPPPRRSTCSARSSTRGRASSWRALKIWSSRSSTSPSRKLSTRLWRYSDDWLLLQNLEVNCHNIHLSSDLSQYLSVPDIRLFVIISPHSCQ